MCLENQIWECEFIEKQQKLQEVSNDFNCYVGGCATHYELRCYTVAEFEVNQ